MLPLVALTLLSPLAAEAARNGLGERPQMGWNNWNALGCDVSQDLIESSASLLRTMGFRDAGYEYIVMDDCWQEPARVGGRLAANATRFPNGIKYLADHVHAQGFKFGMYSTAGVWTCAKYPASLDHEDVDASQFAEWGVDYLKYDNCFNQGRSGTPEISFTRYNAMAQALNATGRPIFYSMCNWGDDRPWTWAQPIANSWRMSGDIFDSFSRPDPRCPCGPEEGIDCKLPGFHCSAMNILMKQAAFADKGIPGAWNDLDALEVGNGGMSDSEYVAHMTMWSLVKSSLLMGNDVRSLDAKGYSILTNPAVIAVSQDAAGTPAFRRWIKPVPADERDEWGQGDVSLWSGDLAGGDHVVALLNTGVKDRQLNATLRDVFVDAPKYAKSGYDLFDLWGNRMPESMAQQIRSANSTAGVQGLDKYWWNATAMSYADGVAKGHSLLLGTRNGSVSAQGTIQALVPARSVRAWRLRPQGSAKTEL